MAVFEVYKDLAIECNTFNNLWSGCWLRVGGHDRVLICYQCGTTFGKLIRSWRQSAQFVLKDQTTAPSASQSRFSVRHLTHTPRNPSDPPKTYISDHIVCVWAERVLLSTTRAPRRHRLCLRRVLLGYWERPSDLGLFCTSGPRALAGAGSHWDGVRPLFAATKPTAGFHDFELLYQSNSV